MTLIRLITFLILSSDSSSVIKETKAGKIVIKSSKLEI